MKILINSQLPFSLAHGGAAIQIEQTKSSLEAVGLQVEYLRWWDAEQRGDIIHYFGRMPSSHIRFAHQKGIKVVMAELLTATGSRSSMQLRLQKVFKQSAERLLPRTFVSAFNWHSYHLVDAVIANTSWEAHLMHYLFDAKKERIHVVPNGVEDVFINTPTGSKSRWLVCSATITERKRILELAQAAVLAQTPIWIIGKAYSESDNYSQNFLRIVKQFPQMIRFEGAIDNRSQLAKIYGEARGFVLLSSVETRSLSAEEAAACKCPLLLSDLPWARSTFGNNATYCPVTKSVGTTAKVLRQFYDSAPNLPAPPKPLSWVEVGRQLKTIYESVLAKPVD